MVLLQIALCLIRFSSLVGRLSSGYLLLCNKIQQFKIIHIYYLDFCWCVIQTLLAWVLFLCVSHGLYVIRCQLDHGLLKVQLGKDLLPRSRGGWQNSVSHRMLPKGFGLHWLLARSPSCQVSSSVCFIKACKPRRCQKGSTRKIDDTVFYNLIKEVTFCHFCCICRF